MQASKGQVADADPFCIRGRLSRCGANRISRVDLPEWLGAARTQGFLSNTRDPGSSGRKPGTPGPRGMEAAFQEVGEAHSIEEAGNDGGEKGPHFGHACQRAKGREIDDESCNSAADRTALPQA